MMTNESSLMLHTALSGSSTNQLELDSTDPKDLFSYKTVLGSNTSELAIVGEKRTFSALSPAENNSSIYSASHQVSRDLRTIIGSTGRPSSRAIEHYDTYLLHLPTRRSSPDTVNSDFLSSEKYFTNARADHRKRTVPTVEECNASEMGFALGLIWDNNDPFTHWQPSSSSSSSLHVTSSVSGGLYSESTAEEHGSEPEPLIKQTPIIPVDNSSMDLLASVATGIIDEDNPSTADVMDEFRRKQAQQARLHHQLSEFEKRRGRAIEYADELSFIVAYTARIYNAAMEKAFEARVIFDRATSVASDAFKEAHRIQGEYFDLSKSFALGEEELMLLRDRIRAPKDPMDEL